MEFGDSCCSSYWFRFGRWKRIGICPAGGDGGAPHFICCVEGKAEAFELGDNRHWLFQRRLSVGKVYDMKNRIGFLVVKRQV